MNQVLQDVSLLRRWLPPAESLSSVSALFLIFWSRFDERLRYQVDQVVGGGPLTQRVVDIAVGWQLKVGLASGYILFIPSWLTISGPSADVRLTVLALILFFGFVFVVYPTLMSPIDRLNAPYTAQNLSWWRRWLGRTMPGSSDAMIYTWTLALPHLALFAASWYSGVFLTYVRP
jgi:hypothetical protein